MNLNKLTPLVTSRRQLLVGTIGFALGGLRVSPAEPVTGEHVSWLEEIQRPPKSIPENTPRLPSLVQRGGAGLIDTVAKWEEERARISQQWLDFLGPLSRAKRTLPEIEIVAEDRDEAVIRQHVRYRVEKDQEVEAYLLRPRQPGDGRPGVAVFHSTVRQSLRQPAGIEGRARLAFGLNLARRGFVTICPRNYLWPESGRLAADEEAERFLIRHPESKGMARMLYDAQIAIDLLVSQPDVDPERLGAVGHSLGAKEVLYLAAFDKRVRVTVSSEGGIGTRFSNWDAPWYLGPAIRQPSFQHEHHELLALCAPRAFLLVGGESADGDRSWPFIEAALPIYRLYQQPAGRPRLGLFNHRQGHEVPTVAEQRIDQWLATYL